MTHTWLHLRLRAPLMSFGGVAIDFNNPTRRFPAASALTGLFANAMGWRREETEKHQSLQDRLIFGAVTSHEGSIVRDMQNVRLSGSDVGWTTWGKPEGRSGGKNAYDNPSRRNREYFADRECNVALRFDGEGDPTLPRLAEVLERPARPLFIGRKSCLPSAPMFAGWVKGETAYDALCALVSELNVGKCKALWPNENGVMPDRSWRSDLFDLRVWQTGIHGGSRVVVEGEINP